MPAKKSKHNIYLVRNSKKLFVKPTQSPAKAKYEHVCQHCGIDFISNRRTAKFCSNSCRSMEWTKNNPYLS